VEWSTAALQFEHAGRRWRYDLQGARLIELPKPEGEQAGQPAAASEGPARSGPRHGAQRDREPSPDGAWDAVCRDFNVELVPAGGAGETIAVTTGGHRKHRYGKASWVYGEELDQDSAMWWSPDSTKLAYYRFDETQVPDYFLQLDQTKLQSAIDTEAYPKAGAPNHWSCR
jgi:dipeptidyl-peptidase-4